MSPTKTPSGIIPARRTTSSITRAVGSLMKYAHKHSYHASLKIRHSHWAILLIGHTHTTPHPHPNKLTVLTVAFSYSPPFYITYKGELLSIIKLKRTPYAINWHMPFSPLHYHPRIPPSPPLIFPPLLSLIHYTSIFQISPCQLLLLHLRLLLSSSTTKTMNRMTTSST